MTRFSKPFKIQQKKGFIASGQNIILLLKTPRKTSAKFSHQFNLFFMFSINLLSLQIRPVAGEQFPCRIVPWCSSRSRPRSLAVPCATGVENRRRFSLQNRACRVVPESHKPPTRRLNPRTHNPFRTTPSSLLRFLVSGAVGSGNPKKTTRGHVRR